LCCWASSYRHSEASLCAAGQAVTHILKHHGAVPLKQWKLLVQQHSNICQKTQILSTAVRSAYRILCGNYIQTACLSHMKNFLQLSLSLCTGQLNTVRLTSSITRTHWCAIIEASYLPVHVYYHM